MSASQPQQPSSDRWSSEPVSNGVAPAPALADWLTAGGLLTARLRAVSQHDLQLEVLDNGRLGDADSLLRRIVICCDGAPCIYAETAIPGSTIAAHPWLASLGDEPLGETLRSRASVERGPFEFRPVAADELPDDITGLEPGSVWARRSEFRIGELPLTVTEYFLPAINQLPPPAMRVADSS